MACVIEGIVLLLSVCFHPIYSSPLSVPLITWRNSEISKESSSVVAGKTQDLSNAFQSYIEPLIKTKPLTLVFLQDELSSDDLTKFSSSYPYLQRVFQSKPYTFLPSVSKGKSSIDKLISSVAGNVEYVDSGSVNDWKYKGGNAKVIIFHLEPVRGSTTSGKADILKNNDLAMHRILKSILLNVNDFGVVYSAEDPSQLIANVLLEENMNNDALASRHLLADTTIAPETKIRTIFYNDCVLLSLKSFKHVMNGNETEFITDDKWKVGGCGSLTVGSCIALEKTTAVGKYSKIVLSIRFRNLTQKWECVSIDVAITYDGKATQESYPCSSSNNSHMIMSPVYDTIEAPDGMSFACHKLTFKKNKTKDESIGSRVILGGFQVQIVCNGKERTFLPASHCVGFFTIEIWTGIIVTIILMLGLYVGVMMMMAIQVQDRLDDPKGKTISVATAGNE